MLNAIIIDGKSISEISIFTIEDIPIIEKDLVIILGSFKNR